MRLKAYLARLRPMLWRVKRMDASSTPPSVPSSLTYPSLLSPPRRLYLRRKLWPSTFCRPRRCRRVCLVCSCVCVCRGASHVNQPFIQEGARSIQSPPDHPRRTRLG